MFIPPIQPSIIVHGGAVATQAHYDGCELAARQGLDTLLGGASALDAALAAAVVMEDDPRFNAGTGSSLCLDGKTIQMDAAVMSSESQFGAVAAITQVKNPVLVARRLMSTPHLILTGEGAERYARRCGFGPYDPTTEHARTRWRNVQRYLKDNSVGPLSPYLEAFDLPSNWNFQRTLEEVAQACDTIGAVARDREGRFAVAASTGGTTLMLLGRVGDVPIMGAGLYAGPAGAVTATGHGEEIIRRMVCKRVYDMLERGSSPEEACEEVVAEFPERTPIGIIALSKTGEGVASNRPMPYVILPSPV
ncbi:MAG: isoaspartyl peptidase/L-asparaginase [Myxococcota bacterium]